MESLKHILRLKPKKRVRFGLLLVSTSIIISISLLAYNMITYEFTLAVGNTGQSALGPPTSAGVGIVFAMIVVAAILGFGAVLSIFGSLRNLSNRITEVVKESLPRDSISGPQKLQRRGRARQQTMRSSMHFGIPRKRKQAQPNSL
jgi:TRAP-type C4-dicarboxylate transport system permease small subunit